MEEPLLMIKINIRLSIIAILLTFAHQSQHAMDNGSLLQLVKMNDHTTALITLDKGKLTCDGLNQASQASTSIAETKKTESKNISNNVSLLRGLETLGAFQTIVATTSFALGCDSGITSIVWPLLWAGTSICISELKQKQHTYEKNVLQQQIIQEAIIARHRQINASNAIASSSTPSSTKKKK